eukprot:scaffold73941_cov53-Phaeocystis_antarctica.AAC.2
MPPHSCPWPAAAPRVRRVSMRVRQRGTPPSPLPHASRLRHAASGRRPLRSDDVHPLASRAVAAGTSGAGPLRPRPLAPVTLQRGGWRAVAASAAPGASTPPTRVPGCIGLQAPMYRVAGSDAQGCRLQHMRKPRAHTRGYYAPLRCYLPLSGAPRWHRGRHVLHWRPRHHVAWLRGTYGRCAPDKGDAAS